MKSKSGTRLISKITTSFGVFEGISPTIKSAVLEFFCRPVIKILGLAILLLGNIHCNEEMPVETELPPLPELADPIPYQRIGEGKLVFERIGPVSNNYSGLYVIDASEKRSWGIDGVYQAPAVSPDAEKIAYGKILPNTLLDIHIMDIDGNNALNIASLDGEQKAPSWVPNNNEVLFWSMDVLRTILYRQTAMPYPPDRVQVVVFENGMRPEGPFSLSQQGVLAVAASGNGTHGIFTMNIDGTNPKLLMAIDTTLLGLKTFHSPTWSPDGQKIAFSTLLRDATGQYQLLDVLVMEADGSNLTILASLVASGLGEWCCQNNLSVCWSPDGSKIAFNKPDGNFVSHIYLMNSDGSQLTQVTSAEGVTDRSVTWAN